MKLFLLYILFPIMFSGHIINSRKVILSDTVNHYQNPNIQQISLLNGKVKLSIPDSLTQLRNDEIKTPIPNENEKRLCVFENKLSKIRILVMYGVHPLDAGLATIEKYFDGFQWKVSSGLKTINNREFFVEEIESLDSSNSKILNESFITIVNKRALLIEYSFPEELKSKYEQQAESIIKTAIIQN